MAGELANQGVAWLGDRWEAVAGDAQKYIDLVLGGPEAWLSELSQLDWGSLVLKFENPYQFQCNLDGLIHDRAQFEEGVKNKRLFLTTLPGFTQNYFNQVFKGTGNLILSFRCIEDPVGASTEKLVRYSFRPRLTGPVLELGKQGASTAAPQATPFLDEEFAAYLSWAQVFRGFELEARVDEAKQKMLIDADSMCTEQLAPSGQAITITYVYHAKGALDLTGQIKH